MTRTALYRHYDAQGDLLYIGITDALGRRTKEHVRGSEWAENIHETKVEYFGSRCHAEDSEKIAIRHEKPLHNKMHTDHASARKEKAKRPKENFSLGGRVLPRQGPLPESDGVLMAVVDKLSSDQKDGLLLMMKVMLVLDGTNFSTEDLVKQVPMKRFIDVARSPQRREAMSA